jgi:hypothetical protein
VFAGIIAGVELLVPPPLHAVTVAVTLRAQQNVATFKRRNMSCVSLSVKLPRAQNTMSDGAPMFQ